MKRQKLFGFSLVLFLCLVFFTINGAVASISLKVALYPSVPRVAQFKEVIENEWEKVAPEVTIDWVDTGWDGGYSSDPDSSFDVYVFDATFLTYFRSKGWLLGLQKSQVEDFDDILEYAAKGVQDNGFVYAIPQIGCANILYYYKNDQAVAKAATVEDVNSAIGSCVFFGKIPSTITGLMADFSGGTTNACYYVQSVHERLNEFPIPLPQNPEEVDKIAISNLKDIVDSSSFKNVYYKQAFLYTRAGWFGQGHGRAFVGFTESLSNIDPGQLDNIAFKVMPWSDNITGNSSPLFYSDVIGIQPDTQKRGTEEYAIKLANLIASTDVIVQCFGPYGSQGPQYLMPVRHSAFQELGSKFPLYSKIYSMVTGVNPILIDLGTEAKNWLGNMKSTIKNMVMADPKCYCDIEAGPIWNNDDAKQKCPDACTEHGGWNGQWTTTIPGQMSVCGCNCGALAQ